MHGLETIKKMNDAAFEKKFPKDDLKREINRQLATIPGSKEEAHEKAKKIALNILSKRKKD
jgi:hypothetical protein